MDPLSEKQILPSLREDLVIVRSGHEDGGLTLYDPVQNRYFQLGAVAVRLLPYWHHGTVSSICQTVLSQTGLTVSESDVAHLRYFLHGNHLLQTSAQEILHDHGRLKRLRGGLGKALLHNYLFFKIPLLRPGSLLERLLPLFQRIISGPAPMFFILVGLSGLILATQQWETFLSTFASLYSWEGLAGFGIALLLLKSLHELGHALTAHHFGCRVSSMGVAFIVMWPVLYTDVSDAWRLPKKSQRMWIAAAGMLTELAVASLALMLWHFLSDGPARSVAFIIATSSWISSLAVNLSPFMRFDGYYLLSDYLQVPNLQERAFRLGRWQLRELLFGSGWPPPETFPRSKRRLLIFYAWGTWVYRFFLFFGIAVLVYSSFTKILGILLFAVEILYFIILPIGRELKAWRIELTTQNSGFIRIRTLFLLGMGLFLFLLPWNPRITAPAILQSAHHTIVFSSTPARIKEIHVERGQFVSRGDRLMVMESPGIANRILQAQHRLAISNLYLERQAASQEVLNQLRVHLQTREMERSVLAGLQMEEDRLIITSSMDGVIAEVKEGLHPGLWIDPHMPLAEIIDSTQAEGRLFLQEEDLSRLEETSHGRFFPNDPSRPSMALQVTKLSPTATRKIPEMLSSLSGGPIASRRTPKGELLAEHPHHEGSFVVSRKESAPPQKVVGQIILEGRPVSMAKRMIHLISALLIRESGF
ncbi:MAG: HlyD family efflux transporter periplasmic adaptor subunit [Magnetococcus sp. THC-1_WYH]